MALPTNSVFEMRSAGNDDNGGGCVWVDLTDRTADTGFKWTASGDEWYLEDIDGGNPATNLALDPDLTDDKPVCISVGPNFIKSTEGTEGSLNAGEWDWAQDPGDSYNTIYVKLSNGGDPNDGPTNLYNRVWMVKYGGEDYSQQDAAEHSDTDGAWTNATLTLTSTGSFSVDMVGNCLQVNDTGSGAKAVDKKIVYITSWIDANSVTLNETITDGSDETNIDYSVGGALTTPEYVTDTVAVSKAVKGNRIFYKGAFDCATEQDFDIDGDYQAPFWLLGYTTTRGDKGLPTFQTTNSNHDLFDINGDHYFIENLSLASNGTQTGTLMALGNSDSTTVKNCYFKPRYSAAMEISSFFGGLVTNCEYTCFANLQEADIITNGTYTSYILRNSYFHDIEFKSADTTTKAIVQVAGSRGVLIEGNIFDTSSKIGAIRTVSEYNNGIWIRNNTFYNIDVYTIHIQGVSSFPERGFIIEKNIFEACELCIYTDALTYGLKLDYNAYWNNTAKFTTALQGENDIDLSASPFVDATNANFKLNNTTGAGAACKNIQIPIGLLSETTNVSYESLGALNPKPTGIGIIS